MANRYEQIQLDSEYQNLLSEIEDLEKERVYCKHDLAHFMDVARIASLIWIEEGSSVELNKDIIYAAALLHDIGRVIEYNEGISHDEGNRTKRTSRISLRNIILQCLRHYSRNKRRPTSIRCTIWRSSRNSRTIIVPRRGSKALRERFAFIFVDEY